MMNPVLFGAKTKVLGDRASTAGDLLVRQAEARGEKAAMMSPQVTGGDTVVLTQKQGETDVDDYDALTEKAQGRFGEIMIERGADPKILAILSGESEEELPEDAMALLGEVSAQVVAESAADMKEFLKDAESVNAADVLAKAEKKTDALQEVTSANFDADVVEASKKQPVVVDFWAPWCGPCKQMEKPLKELAAEYGDNVKVVKLNVDDNEDIAERFGVMSMPTFLVFRNGEPGDFILGSQPKADLKQAIDAQLA